MTCIRETDYVKNQRFKQVKTDAGALTQLKNQLVWWAVEVRAHEICEEREAA